MNKEKSLIPFYTHGITMAPMAGVTDSAFRRICIKLGATCLVTEMITFIVPKELYFIAYWGDALSYITTPMIAYVWGLYVYATVNPRQNKFKASRDCTVSSSRILR